MDWIYAALIMFGLVKHAPAEYHSPVKTLPLIERADNVPQAQWIWGPK